MHIGAPHLRPRLRARAVGGVFCAAGGMPAQLSARGNSAACDAGRDSNSCNAVQILFVYRQGLHAVVCGVVATVTLLLAPPLRCRLDLMRLICEKHTPDTMKTDATALAARAYQNSICCRNHRSTCAPQCHVIFCCALLFGKCCLINKTVVLLFDKSHIAHTYF